MKSNENLKIVNLFSETLVNSCIQCESNDTNTDCVFPDRLAGFTNLCENGSGSCFTRVLGENYLKLFKMVKFYLKFLDNGHLRRGCGAEVRNVTGCDGESETCQVCQLLDKGSAACNIEMFPSNRLSCYICDGDRNSTCATLDRDDASLHAQLCPIFRNDDSCFATRAGGNVTRGCASSVPRGRCDHGVCGFCRGPNCNSGEFDSLSSAFSMQHGVKFLALLAAIFAIINL